MDCKKMNELENLNVRESAEETVAAPERPVGAGLPETDVLPAYLFHQGTNFKAYDYLGAHCE